MPRHSADRGEVSIALAIDDGYVAHFATSVASIAASCGSESVRFFLLQGPNLSEQSVRSLRDFVREHGMELESITITDDVAASLPPTRFYAPIVWYRLLIPELLPYLDRVLVLDADLLVLQSLWPLYETDLDGHLLAAVGATPGEWVRGLGLDPHAPYLNTGVMLMNLEAMRAEKVGPRAIALGHERNADLIFPEQDALNVIANGRWDLLHPRWNALSYLWLTPSVTDPTYPRLDQDSARLSPAIVHFEGFQTVKPWFYRSVHPLRFLYRDFRATTPWPMERLENKSVSGALLRALPIRSQNTIIRTKARLASRLTRRS